MVSLTRLAAALAALITHVLAQAIEASVPSQNNTNPIQLEDPRHQTSYISPDSPTPIPISSSRNNAVVACTTLDGISKDMADVSCSTYEGITSFSGLTTGATGIMTASETRSNALSTTGAMRTTSGSGTKETLPGTRTRGLTASNTESGQGSGAERQELSSVWERILVMGVLAIVGGVVGL